MKKLKKTSKPKLKANNPHLSQLVFIFAPDGLWKVY